MIDKDKEMAARLWRDAIYGKPSTDINWDNCREHWLKDFAKFEALLAEHGIKIIKEL